MSGWDAVRRAIIAEANQEDDGNFFTKLGDIEPDHHPDDHHSRGLFQGIVFNLDQALDADRKRRLRNNETWPAKGGWVRSRMRTRRVRVVKRRTFFNLVFTWSWRCRLCLAQSDHLTWKRAYTAADHHARNHH